MSTLTLVLQGIHQLPMFVMAGLLLNLTPGPDVLYIIAQATGRGMLAGVCAALGITAGCFVHIAAATIGVSALILASTTAFTLLKWLGAAYLVYMGLGLLFARRVSPTGRQMAPLVKERTDLPMSRIFWQGFATNALNPKVAVFFLAFLPQFIQAGAGHKTATFVLLGLIFNVNGLWVNLVWATTAAWVARRFTRLQHALGGLNRVAGLMFVGFGLKLAFTDNLPR